MQQEPPVSGSVSWDSMDVHLLRVLHALLTERSVSKAARRLNQSQPATSAALKRLRRITGDQLLVRGQNGLAPTERGLAILEPVKLALAQIESIVVSQVRFDPAKSRRVFNMATPDYLSAALLGQVIARMRASAPQTQLNIHSLGPDYDFAAALQTGELDVVIANWPKPPPHLRLTPLFDDRVVCVVRRDHPLAGQPICAADYLKAEHLAPTPYSVGRRSAIEAHLSHERVHRNVVACIPYFNVVPYVLLQTDLIFTTHATFAQQLENLFQLTVVDVQLNFPPLSVYLLSHDRAHYAEESRWFRDQIVAATRTVLGPMTSTARPNP